MKISVADIRTEYKKGTLNETEVHQNPHTQFELWFKEAVKSEIPEVNAMTLATASKSGRPAARTVLLKNYDARGFVFLRIMTAPKAMTCKKIHKLPYYFFGNPSNVKYASSVVSRKYPPLSRGSISAVAQLIVN
jgi:pyridoxine/pyridoxamine 5'-phosphate oxidase